MGKPTFKQVLDALKLQILRGKSYLGIAKGLLSADPVLLDGARTFFNLTIDGNLELAQMAVARMYDRTKGAVTIPTMLVRAKTEVASFKRGGHAKINQAITKAQGDVAGLQGVLQSIHTRRNEWLAHLDPRTVSNSAALTAKANLTIPDLERALKVTEEIVIDMSSFYEGVIGDLHYLGDGDYKAALDWIRKAKCVYIERFEQEHGAGSWTGQRPKDCSRNPWDLM